MKKKKRSSKLTSLHLYQLPLIFRLNFLVLDSSSLPNFMPLPSLAKFYPLESLCLSSSKCSDSSCTSKVTSCPNLPSCQTQPWSSLYPDLKSQFPLSPIM